MPKLGPRENQGFWETLYSPTALQEAIEWITKNFGPEDIFEEKDLEEWARNSGFKKEGE